MITLDVNNASRYDGTVIRSFRARDSEDAFNRLPARRLPSHILRAARRKLLILDAAESLADLRVPPGNRLERLSGAKATPTMCSLSNITRMTCG